MPQRQDDTFGAERGRTGRPDYSETGTDHGEPREFRFGSAFERPESGFPSDQERSRGYSGPHDVWEPSGYVFYSGRGYHREFFDPFAGPRSSRQGSPRGRYTGLGPKGYTRSDERIREEVCEALERDGKVDASEIEVRAQDGEVTLEGTVSDRPAKRRAEDLAAEVRGVRDVQNRIRVSAPAGTGAGGADVEVSGSESRSGSGFLTDRGSPRSRGAAGPPGNRER